MNLVFFMTKCDYSTQFPHVVRPVLKNNPETKITSLFVTQQVPNHPPDSLHRRFHKIVKPYPKEGFLPVFRKFDLGIFYDSAHF